jgi:hypothetical protein
MAETMDDTLPDLLEADRLKNRRTRPEGWRLSFNLRSIRHVVKGL